MVDQGPLQAGRADMASVQTAFCAETQPIVPVAPDPVEQFSYPGFDLSVFNSLDSTNKHLVSAVRQGRVDVARLTDALQSQDQVKTQAQTQACTHTQAQTQAYTQAQTQAQTQALACIAKTQTTGRGRSGNQWVSGEGNLNLSVLTKPKRPMLQWSSLSLVAAFSIARVIAMQTGINASLKWPNDVLLGDAKVAGILPEVVYCPDGYPYLATGIGLNLLTSPAIKGRPTTSLKAHCTAMQCDLIHWGRQILEAIVRDFDRWERVGFDGFRDEWLSRGVGIGQEITVRLPNERFAARMLDLKGDGALQVELPNGEVRSVTSGEVFFGGPA